MSCGLLPEQKARIKIDELLKKAGWDIISRNEYSDIYNACAITEALLTGNLEADYLLFVGGKAKQNALKIISQLKLQLKLRIIQKVFQTGIRLGQIHFLSYFFLMVRLYFSAICGKMIRHILN